MERSQRPKARRRKKADDSSAESTKRRVRARAAVPAEPVEAPAPPSALPKAPTPPQEARPDESNEIAPSPPTAGHPDLAAAQPRPSRASRRPASEPGVVLVTGIVGRLGQLLARRLHRSKIVVGVDRREFWSKPKDILHYKLDIRRNKTRDIFRKHRVEAVVHLGSLHDPRATEAERHRWNVAAFQKLLGYVGEFEVPKLVVLSSGNVYGPQPDNPQFLTEEAPLLGSQGFQSMRDLVEMDMLAQSFFWRTPSTETVVLRPAHILGGVRNAPSNYLRLPRPLTILGFDPMIQVIHERDVVHALELSLRAGVRGVFNLRGPGELPLSRVLRSLGRSPLPVPGFAARPIVDQLWKLRMTSFPSPELDFIRYVCMVDDTRARNELGFAPQYSLDETLRAVLTER